MHLIGFHYKNLKNSSDAVEIITALTINLFLNTWQYSYRTDSLQTWD